MFTANIFSMFKNYLRNVVNDVLTKKYDSFIKESLYAGVRLSKIFVTEEIELLKFV